MDQPQPSAEAPAKASSGWMPALCLVILISAAGVGWKLWDSDQLKMRMEQHSRKYSHAYSDDCDMGSGCARKEINGGRDPYK